MDTWTHDDACTVDRAGMSQGWAAELRVLEWWLGLVWSHISTMLGAAVEAPFGYVKIAI